MGAGRNYTGQSAMLPAELLNGEFGCRAADHLEVAPGPIGPDAPGELAPRPGRPNRVADNSPPALVASRGPLGRCHRPIGIESLRIENSRLRALSDGTGDSPAVD